MGLNTDMTVRKRIADNLHDGFYTDRKLVHAHSTSVYRLGFHIINKR